VSGYGVIAMKSGTFPTLTGRPARPVAVVIGVTVPEPSFVTQAVLPSGVIAISKGLVPTLIAFSAVFVAVRIGVTVPEPKLAT
jgi:hypothetical protein